MNNFFFPRKNSNQKNENALNGFQILPNAQENFQNNAASKNFANNTFASNSFANNTLANNALANNQSPKQNQTEAYAQNRAQNYYPEFLNVPDSAAQKEQTFDVNDLSQFQQDFSYLQSGIFQQKSAQNEEKTQKMQENFENFAQNSSAKF